ncbi:MAG: HupE/UreJ family protein [Cyanobacteria bacterium P01_G01_bin.38]
MNAKALLSKSDLVSREYKRFLLLGMTVGGLACSMWFLGATAASAHHPFGGATPSNFIQGFLSGVGHPLIGPDHFAFIIAVGLLAAVKKQGMIIPVTFVLAGLAGAGLHLAGFNLPAPEFFVSASVLLFGGLLALKQSPKVGVIAALAAIAGLFHGFAYGEAIFGAEMTPLVSYLMGFTLVQMGVAVAAFKAAQAITKKAAEQPLAPLRFVGFAISGAGAAFLSSVVLG